MWRSLAKHSVLVPQFRGSIWPLPRTSSKAPRKNSHFSSHPPHHARSLPQYSPARNTSAPRAPAEELVLKTRREPLGLPRLQTNRRPAACESDPFNWLHHSDPLAIARNRSPSQIPAFALPGAGLRTFLVHALVPPCPSALLRAPPGQHSHAVGVVGPRISSAATGFARQ